MSAIGTAVTFAGPVAHPSARAVIHVPAPHLPPGEPPTVVIEHMALRAELQIAEVEPPQAGLPETVQVTPPLVASAPPRIADPQSRGAARGSHKGARHGSGTPEQPSAQPPSQPAPVPSNAAGGGSAATGVGGHVPIGLAALLVLMTLIRPAGINRAVRPAARSVTLVPVVERPD
jgi:hypothetical protein